MAAVTADGSMPALAAKEADGAQQSQTDDIVRLPEGMLERKSSIRTERRRAKFIECLNEEVVQMGAW